MRPALDCRPISAPASSSNLTTAEWPPDDACAAQNKSDVTKKKKKKKKKPKKENTWTENLQKEHQNENKHNTLEKGRPKAKYRSLYKGHG